MAFRLIDDPTGEWVQLLGLVPEAVSIERNRPGECDTCDVSLTGDALPFDLGIIAPKSALVSVWLFEHQTPGKCGNGDPGQFFGVADAVVRDRGTLNVSIKARDLTAIPLGAKLSEEQIKQFPIETAWSIEQIVTALIKAVPGTWDWRVESRSAASSRPGLQPPKIEPKEARRGTRAGAPKATLSTGTAHLADIVPPHQLTVWSAIANVCARAGIVPEVSIDRNGNPVVLLVDGHDLQTSDVIRPFRERNGRRWRVLVDGDGISEFRETLTISGGERRPDFVQVDSIDPLTGQGLSARWPAAKTEQEKKAAGEDVEEHGVFQFVRGITSEAALERMAQAGFEALAHNTFRAEVTVREPWSAGGSPEDPDLLDIGYGAAVEIAMPRFEEVAKVKGLETPAKILAARKVDPRIINRILQASERMRELSLLFQVEGVQHRWQGGKSPGYSCELTLRRFLGTADLPIIRPRPAETEEPRRGRVGP